MKSASTELSGNTAIKNREAIERLSSLSVPLWILAGLALGVLLYQASIIFLWIVSSFLLFALVDPWMQRLNRRGIAPVVSALMLVSLFTGVAVALGLLLYKSFPGFVTEFESYRKTIMHLYEMGSRTLSEWTRIITRGHAPTVSQQTTTTTTTTFSSFPSGFGSLNGLSSTMWHGLGTALTALTYAVLCPILTFFFIAERKIFANVFASGFFGPNQGELIWKRITESTGAFFLGNFLLLGISFPVFWAIFLYFNLPSALTMAVIASVFNLVPFLGAVMAGALPTLSLISQNESVTAGLTLFGSCLLVHFFIANIITPKILGSRMSLNATVSTIALIAWGQLWGGMGLLLAIPLTSVIKILFQYSGNERLHWIAMLMSDDPDSLLKQGYRRFKKAPRAKSSKKDDPSVLPGSPLADSLL